MNRTFLIKRGIATLATMAMVLGSGAGAALAAGPVAGTTVSPPVYDLQANPGQTIIQKMTVHNDADASQSYTPVVNTIAPANEQGGLAFGPASSNDLSGWITVTPSKLDLAANQSGDFTITIKVPTNASAGGHYATVFAKSENGTVSVNGATLTPLVGTSLLLKVAGQTRESADVVEFSTQRARVIPGEPIDFTVRVRNSGNVHVKPQGTIEIYNGNVKVDEVPVNADALNVLPGSIRLFSAVSNKTLPAGSYRAELSLVYGAGQTVSVPAISFVVIGETSMATMVAIILGIFVVILLAALLMNRRPMSGKKS
ncbi:MAG TPA: DUF916 domain-containing protein [Verrucomicrobiae bacterium]|nr:DUF916 domain-containing protein [Verrucomicrobiae bacterium]